jgi:arginine decarboxylase-like protein
VHEAEVILGPKGAPVVSDVRRGEASGDTLECFGYSATEMAESVRAQLRERVNRGDITPEDADAFVETYVQRLAQYTYLV